MKKATNFFTATLLVLMCFITLSVNAQRCAVLEFKAGVGISQADVDGISAIFITYFQPAGYTMVERTQIDKVIEEQGFQRSKMTQSQMVRVGQILNVSKIVVGDINFVMNQYNVDTRVINVETGTIAATEGATFATSSYRSSMQNVATKLASKIAITSGGTVSAQSNTSSYTPKKRTSVEVLYGYLKVFPNEIGIFQAEPTSVINQINSQAQYGYNNWRIPTNEELSLMRANNYLGSGDYMSRENKRGIVLLVSDGKDYATLQNEALERQRAEQERVEQERQRKAALRAQGWVDLGLPSGILWKDKNEEGQYSYDRAVDLFGVNLPTKEQFQELLDNCEVRRVNGSAYKFIGPNGEYIILPADGQSPLFLGVGTKGRDGIYWSSTPVKSNGTVRNAYHLKWYNNYTPYLEVSYDECSHYCRSVRLVMNP
jgi:hypothetical protein